MIHPFRDNSKLVARSIALAVVCAFSGASGCHRDMHDQPRYEAYEASATFANNMSSRPLVEGTVARGALDEEDVRHTGKDESGQSVFSPPVEIDRALLERGKERFNIYCSVCHDFTGSGNGMIVQRGFRKPPSFHEDRLRNAPAGHYFDVISNGYGVMPSYRAQIPADDRWAIVAYIRVLQMSRMGTIDDVPADQRALLEEGSK